MDKTIQYDKTANKDEAYEAVKKAITPETIAKFKVSADLDYRDGDKKILAKGKGFELKIDFMEDQLGIDLSLSFMLKPFKPKIIEGLEKQLVRIV
ncbi:MAG: hypothetical protein CME67_05520 [Halobacteriovoraceae bacterium]|nr:hypothetical protein [Halobacteriovoraceae bacterium]|tara:strand:+ start:2521 stop:2805 length:285 start_codon:yes stop_codon:yes gene_type:complete